MSKRGQRSRNEHSQEVADLKQEVKRLCRELARLRKDNERLGGEECPENEEVEPVKDLPTCPNCGSTNLGEMVIPSGKKVVSCRACKKWRARPV